ncbi:hypothetical protein [Brevundimonas sp. FT23028]|uniref:hypothetical protein n=1 Tax=Brevundimonas sp. FT23028 TaxID=3393748 RepID=UPI003B58A89A
MVFMAAIGAICAGIFLAAREILPWLDARRTGVIRTRGDRPRPVLRTEEPDRFHALANRRLGAAGTGLLLLIGGLSALFWSVVDLVLVSQG